MNNVFDYIIYTDGSANSGPTGGSACIVEDTNSLERHYLVSSYGTATNNQSEIFATLMGYSYIDSLQSKEVPWKIRIKVISDSEHVLDCSVHHINSWVKSGKLYNNKIPLKNRGFWQLFAHFQKSFSIVGEHVKGHSGHFDNERCDNAASWARKARIENPEFTKNCVIELIKKKRKTKLFADNWFHYDAEPIFNLLRDDDNLHIPEAYNLMRTASLEVTNSELDFITTQDRVLKSIIDRLKEAITMANKYKSKDNRIEDLESKLLELVGEYKDEHY